MAREARRKEFPTAAAVYNKFNNSEGIYLILLIYTRISAPSGREPLVSANFGHRIVGRDDEVRKRTLKNALHSSTRRAVVGIAMVVI